MKDKIINAVISVLKWKKVFRFSSKVYLIVGLISIVLVIKRNEDSYISIE